MFKRLLIAMLVAGVFCGSTVPGAIAAEDEADKTESTEGETDQTESTEDETDQTESTEDETDQTESTEDETDKAESTEGEADQDGSTEAVLCEWVIPPQYEEISQVTETYFVAAAANTQDGAVERYDLYNWEGKPVIQGKTSYEFFDKWIIANNAVPNGEATTDACSVYTYDGAECRVPEERGYVRIWLKDDQTAVGLKGADFVRPGYWVGSAEEINLETGKVTKQLGDMSEEASALPTRFGTPQELFATAKDSPYGVTFVNTSDEGSSEEVSDPISVRQIQVYNKDGQLLFDTGPDAAKVWVNMTVSCHGSLFGFYGDDGTVPARNLVYTGRGRKLLDHNAIGLLGGQYLAVMEDDCHDILTRDGELVQTGLQEVHGNHAVMNNDGSGTGATVATSDDLVIVKKDDHWGVLRLAKTMPKTSGWAAEEVGHAVEAGLVPEDVQLWWRDSCTRLEFSQMLARTLEAASGKTLAELVADTPDATPVTFSDCSDPDVLAVASLGVIQGVGDGKFAPGVFLNRQQAATLLSRAAALLDIQGTETAPVFADADQFASWAADGIQNVASIVSQDGKAVMQGVGDGQFAPTKYYTVEQSAVTLYRLLRSVA